MFPRSQRLRNSYDIKKVIIKGNVFKMPFFILKYFSWLHLKITIIVNKKNNTLATNRNRIKRIFRSAICNVLKKTKWIKWSLVFFPHPSTLSLKSSDLEAQISNVFNKIINK